MRFCKSHILCVATVSRYPSLQADAVQQENSTSQEELQIILGYMAPYFPVKLDHFTGRGDIKVELF
jgi:hypothetical protein